MHKDNRHAKGYNFQQLATSYPALSEYIINTPDAEDRIDFADYRAVKALNQALLSVHYDIKSIDIPDKFLIPPIPGRVEYIHHLSDLVGDTKATILDIGTGASLIYPLLGTSIYNWKFKATDINEGSIEIAKKQLQANPDLTERIEVVQQPDRGSIFKNAILPGDSFSATMCNPPFYTSEDEAVKANIQKNKNLGIASFKRNFMGISSELWCNGGEALFIKRMIKESVQFKSQVDWFTTLVSQSSHLPKINKQLDKLKTTHKTVSLTLGNKKMRFVAWKFDK